MSHTMSHAAFLYVEGSQPPTAFRDLDRVATTCAARTEDGRVLPAGSEGTIVDVVAGGLAYTAEFSRPIDALATLLPDEVRRLGPVVPPARRR